MAKVDNANKQGVRVMPEIGQSRRAARRIQAGKHSESHRPHPIKYVSYCPECEPSNKNTPQNAPHIVVGNYWRRKSEIGFCKNGHSWECC